MATRVKTRLPKTRDQRAAAHYRVLANQHQNRDKLISGEIDEEWLWERSFDYADKTIKAELDAAERGEVGIKQRYLDLENIRKEREQEYRTLYAWNTASDERTLSNILDNEMYTVVMVQQLQDPSLNMTEREKLLDRHSKLVKDHKDLLVAAGIDRLTREKKQATYEPLEDWNRVKLLSYQRMQKLQVDFPAAVADAASEGDLRDIIKYHLGYDFENIIDPLLANHRRTLGLTMEIERL